MHTISSLSARGLQGFPFHWHVQSIYGVHRTFYPYEIGVSFCVEKCALHGFYAASSGNFLPTFRDNVSFPLALIFHLTFCLHLLRKKDSLCVSKCRQNVRWNINANIGLKFNPQAPNDIYICRAVEVFNPQATNVIYIWSTHS